MDWLLKNMKKPKILEFHSVKDPIKILGTHLSYNADKNLQQDS